MLKKIKLNYSKTTLFNCFAIVSLLIIFCTSLYFYSTKYLEPHAYDFLTRLSLHKNGSQNIVNVIIDDESLYEIGRWPWKRTYYADIFEYLEKYSGAKVVVFDSIIASNGDKANDKNFFKRVSGLQKLVSGVDIAFNKDANDKNKGVERFQLNVSDLTSKRSNSSGYNLINVLPEYAKKLDSIGAVAVYPDNDGVIRKIEPIVKVNKKFYPSLALAALMKYEDIESYVLKNDRLVLKTKNETVVVPINNESRGYSYLKWYKPFDKTSLSSHKSYSAWKVIRSYEALSDHKRGQKPLISPDEFKDKIVVIGATAAALQDIKTTPLGTNYPGVDVQSTFIDNLINKDIIKQSSSFVNVFTVIMFVLAVWLLITLLNPIFSSIAIAVLVFSYFYFALVSVSLNYAVNVVTPFVFVILTMVAGYAYRFFIEGNRKEKIQAIMGKYVSNEVMCNIMKNINEVKPGGKKEELTVLFVDIRGFTSISEVLEPDEVTKLLNEYFEEMVPLIEKYNGVLNKFMGDALLAIFGEPVKDENHPKNAVLCALEMIEKVDVLREKWHEQGKPKINIGVGINTGISFVGNIGTCERMEYTVIGDTVNVASRIEAQNRLFNTRLLISEYTYERIKDLVDVIRISSVSIKGREKNVDIYEVMNLIEPNDIETKKWPLKNK